MIEQNLSKQISFLQHLIDQIELFRQESVSVAKKDGKLNDSKFFYDVLKEHAYTTSLKKGFFYNIISLLEEIISRELDFSVQQSANYTFWFNYNPKFFSEEELGRIINENELAYRISRTQSQMVMIDIINSDNRDDYNVYAFNSVIGNGRKLDDYKEEIISVQEILSKHSEIELIKVYWDNIINSIVWEIKKYDEYTVKKYENELVPIFSTAKQLEYYSIFLKKTFGISIPQYLLPPYLQNGTDEFEYKNAKYTPVVLYMCNLSSPFSSEYSGSIMFASDRNIEVEKVTGAINNIKGVINLLTDIEASYLNSKNKQLIKQEAVKSAKAAIMSRNMSHNIGSHVMSYLKQHLCSVTNILQDNVLSDFISSSSFSELSEKIEQAKSNNDSFVKYTKELSTEEGSLALPFLVGLGNFISYLQERQDFIATIATDYIPYYSTVNFKDFIYDALNPDKRYLRHKDRKNLQPDNILLGNIARSEGLGRTISPTEKENGKLSDIIIKFRGFDGNPVVNESNIIITGREEAFKDLEFMRGIDVSLPGGMVGRQAIFSIVENIIRNAAKHGNWRNQGKLELTFDFFTKDSIKEEFVRLKQREYPILKKRINGIDLDETEQVEYDRIRTELDPWTKDASSIEGIHPWGEITMNKHLSLIEVLYLFYSQSIDADDLYFVTITDNIKISETAVNQLRSALTEDYIGSDAKMKEGNKGLKEIRISAAWLRGAKNEDDYYNSDARILEPQTGHKAPLVYARQHYGCLQYIICLLIPKRVAIVSDSFGKEVILNKDADKKLSDSYWNIFTPSEYIEEKNKSYNFVVCDGEECYNMIRPYASSRIVEISSVENVERNNLFECIQNGISQVECHRIELSLYKYFANYKEGKDIICVDDKKAYARFVNQPTTIAYQWHASSKDEKTGHFLRCQGDSQEVIGVDKEELYDGMGLIPEHNYCKVGNVLVTDGGGFGQYVYRTHHDMNEEFARFMEELRNNYKGCQFVESVTGNSSTDRLVRNDSLDDKWFYSHLRAMKQQIAIFDERLFAKFYGLEEVDFTRANAASGTLDERKKEYIRQFPPNFASNINKCKSVDELNMYISSNNALMKKLYRSEAGAKSRSVSVNYQKGIYVFTFVRDSQRKNTYGMYGLCLKPDKTDVLDAIENVFHATTMKLVDLSWENDSLKITPEPGTEYPAKCFDYISIHQGLLDKLYDAFGIKNNEKAKVELTKRLYLFLKRGDQEIMNVPMKDGNSIQKEERLFMPGIIVHSGRSKPNKNDMPQLLPFIQYAAIEHAALDCKYSLVELLDNARIEL